MSTHPFDRNLSSRGWQRAGSGDIKGGSKPLALRLICPTPRINIGSLAGMAVVDVHAWVEGSMIKLELATATGYPPVLEQFVRAGKRGRTPFALGLIACHHDGVHWNGFCLPLIWQQSMNDLGRFTKLASDYGKLLKDRAWQCPDAQQII
jgi:hypothetical protein